MGGGLVPLCSDRSSSSRKPQFVNVNDSEFFILFQSYLKDFPKASPRKYTPARSSARDRTSCSNPGYDKGLGFMATQTVAFRDGHQGVGDLDVVRQRFNTHDTSGGLPRGSKLRTSNSTSESVHNCVHDSERNMGIRAAMKIVLDFIRAAKPRDLTPQFWDG